MPMNDQTKNRCRLVLVAPADVTASAFFPLLKAALSGGDVASVILPNGKSGEAAFQALAEAVVPVVQAAGAAAIVAEDTRIAGRVGADGVHLESGRAELDDFIERNEGRLIVGTGGVRTRDEALELGEARPDYLFFGRFGADSKPEPHNRNLTLGRWWAEMIQIPCIVQGGASLESVSAVAETGADFVALSAAVFGEGVDPAGAVTEANRLLDLSPVRFEG